MDLFQFLGVAWNWLPSPLPGIFTAFFAVLVIWVVFSILLKLFDLIIHVFL